jgi:hypothetical protein
MRPGSMRSHNDRRPPASVIVVIDSENRIVARSGQASESLKAFLDEQVLVATIEEHREKLSRGAVQIHGSTTMRVVPLQGRVPGLRGVIFEEVRLRESE